MANLNIEQPSSVEEILETGVLDNWYLVARDTDVDSKPVGLTRLSRDELLGVLDAYELAVPDRRVKDQLVEVLATSEQVQLDDILQAFPAADILRGSIDSSDYKRFS